MNLSYSHLPDGLANNRLFRKLFLFRKMYLTRRSFSHHGQYGEDIAIARHVEGRSDGFFVDVGCFHPVKYNNTYALYRKGWRGVNIDLDPVKIEGFEMVRPRDVNIACAVTDAPGRTTVWSRGFYSLTSTLDEEFARTLDGDFRQRTIDADTLTNILDRTEFRDRRIDLLTVDVEGHDLAVLRSLDFERYRPRLVAVELHQPTLTDVRREPLFDFLRERGYDVVNWTGPTILFSDVAGEVRAEGVPDERPPS
jgi:hypothetical protein